MKDFFHILNPNQVRRRAVNKFFDQHPELNSIWIDRDSHPAHLETVVQWAINENHHQIAVWGGDGTLSRVVQSLYEFNAFDKVLVALIPAGTCNDFARRLGIPHWRRYVKKTLNTPFSEHLVDVGLVETKFLKRIFINNAGFGRTKEASRKKSNPISDIFSFSPKKLDLDWEINGTHQFETRDGLLGVICNGPFFSKGLYFEKQLDVEDGLLNAFFESPQSRWHLLLKFLKGRMGRSLLDEKTWQFTAQKISVHCNHPLYPQIDGEPMGSDPTQDVSYSVFPRTLRLALF